MTNRERFEKMFGAASGWFGIVVIIAAVVWFAPVVVHALDRMLS